MDIAQQIDRLHTRVSDVKDDINEHELACAEDRVVQENRLTKLESAVATNGRLLWAVLILVVGAVGEAFFDRVVG